MHIPVTSLLYAFQPAILNTPVLQGIGPEIRARPDSIIHIFPLTFEGNFSPSVITGSESQAYGN
jgi:hypothetical protein